MKFSIRIILSAAVILTGAVDTMAIEEAAYKVLTTSGKFEIREYAPQILAEIVIEGDLEEAGNKAFRPLFNYISGANRSHSKVPMSAPVTQEKSGEKIAMTAPVNQQRSGDKWVVSFTMPASYSMDTLPVPDDPQITLRQVPARRMAAVRYSGFWSEKRYLQHKSELDTWILEQGLTVTGVPVWARYNPPFTPWFLRRNEILIPLGAGKN